MGILVTIEEWAALMGVESVPVNGGMPDRQNNQPYYKSIRMAPLESAPTPSLRDLISNEEIAALLAQFPVENEESTPVKWKNARVPKHSQAKISQR
jgi:hypothetical protein